MLSRAVRIFSIGGIAIRLDPSWLVIAALVIWTLAGSYFPETFPEASPQLHMLMAVGGMLGLFASLLAHEIAHGLVAIRLGLPVRSITLFLFGGLAELSAEPASPGDELRIALAGPLASLALAAGFWMLSQTAGRALMPPPMLQVLSYLALVNLVLALFNLLPAFPMDGAKIR